MDLSLQTWQGDRLVGEELCVAKREVEGRVCTYCWVQLNCITGHEIWLIMMSHYSAGAEATSLQKPRESKRKTGYELYSIRVEVENVF